MTDVLVTPDPAPGPGARVSRTSGQVGGALVLVELWQAFGWFGADAWTAEQAAQRWPAVTATMYFLISVGHNVWNWWRSRDQAALVPESVNVRAVDESGQSQILVIVLVVVLLLILLGAI